MSVEREYFENMGGSVDEELDSHAKTEFTKRKKELQEKQGLILPEVNRAREKVI